MVTELPPLGETDLNNRVWPQSALTLPTLPIKILESARDQLKADSWSEGREFALTYVFKNIRWSWMRGWVVYSPQNWATHGYGPLWLETNQRQFSDQPQDSITARKIFAAKVGRELPLDGVTERKWKAIAVPLVIQPESPESIVVNSIVDQLSAITSISR